ncbi:MAG: cysteine peptidase family C39 domain-containing protein [Chloroflexota bacterium]|nr:cysteine peptidase family C39 domain-containing protein [Chloroflexota bacterium]
MNAPHFEQELDYSCLAACARMVLAFWGVEHTEAELRALLKTRPGGTSPINLMLRLPALGFTADVQTGSQPDLIRHVESGHPCIVHVWTPPLPHWDAEAIHALVVTETDKENVHAHDPVFTMGPTAIPLPAFSRAWAAVNYLMIIILPRVQ